MTQTLDLLMETPFFDDAAPGPSGIDVLSDILRVFHVTGAALLRGEFGAPWAWHAPSSSEIANLLHPGATQLIIFHVVAEGSCWVEVDGEERCMLRSGDIVGFPHGHPHRLGSGKAELIPIASLFPALPWMDLPVVAHGGTGERTHIVCVYLRCDLLSFEPFLASLPNLIIVRRDQGPSGQWFDANMRYLVAEAVRARPGTSCMMARLTELLFIEMLRLQMAQLREEDVGWLAALNDRYTYRALNLFHSRPADRWTVETLAREVGLSRSALVRRFDRMLNMSPIRYLATWRLSSSRRGPARRQQSHRGDRERGGILIGGRLQQGFQTLFRHRARCLAAVARFLNVRLPRDASPHRSTDKYRARCRSSRLSRQPFTRIDTRFFDL